MIESTLPDFKLPEAEDDYDRRLLADVTRIGWHHVHVEGDGDGPAFAFSLGFYANYRRPEVIVFGLPPKTAQQFLNIVAVKVAGAGEALVPFKAYEDIAEGVRIAFVPVARRHYPEYLGYAGWFYASVKADLPVLQMVWPDRQGLFPWEQGWDTSFASAQPMLCDKEDQPAGADAGDDWPFDSPPNVMCFTVRGILEDAKPILMVSRDEEDGAWQFLTGDAFEMADAKLVSLQSMVERDASLRALADMPAGWMAWRESPASAWSRQAQSQQTDD
jgi:hypothetical protein